MRKRNFVEWAMHYRQIVILCVTCLIAFGIYSLPQMRKNEFPDFTIRQGLVVAVAPGNSAQDMVEQVTKPLEDYIFSYKEVKKEKTFSTSRDGIVYIQVELNDDLTDKDEFWSKFKHGMSQFKSKLPDNVLAVQVLDDFGDTSALLITLESEDKTYRELDSYMDLLQARLRCIPSVGRMTVSGMQREQVTVRLDNDRLSKYGLSDKTIALELMKKGFVTAGGRVKTEELTMPVHVERSFNTVYDVQQQIVYADPQGNVLRLKDVADVVREYPDADSYITNNGKKCLLLSVEMKKGQNVVQMGEDVNAVMTGFEQELPDEVEMFRITDQSQVVGDSVNNFLKELIIAIIAVVIVVVLLLPVRVALVAASTIPITIFISLGLFYALGIELNTVTLAALIVTLGMIVDNSIVIIDNYLEKLGEGMSRWHASIESTTHFFKSIFSATLAISITFFPFLAITTGIVHDFVLYFPWGVTIVLGVSLLVASLLVPFMQFWFIRKPVWKGNRQRKSFSFLDALQSFYNRVLDWCFAHPKATVLSGVGSVALGALMMMHIPQTLMPTAERNQFAVEIYMPTGTSLDKTVQVADSLEHILRQDPRIVSVTSFKGCSSPRFHTVYAPQIAGANYAQFIVNTKGVWETEELLDELAPRYTHYFPDALVRFKQLNYSEAATPVEIRLSGEDEISLKHESERVLSMLRDMPQVSWARSDMREPLAVAKVRLKEDEASRMGVDNAMVESVLAMRYGDGISVADVWEDDYNVPIVLKSGTSGKIKYADLQDELIPVAGGMSEIPLRQIADVVPDWTTGQIVRRNGVPTVTLQADLQRGENGLAVSEEIMQRIEQLAVSPDVTISYGGDLEDSADNLPTTMTGLQIAAVMIFFILMAHYKNIGLAFYTFASMLLCLFGTAVGLLVMGLDFSITSILGITSLMGIIVRNGIIMIDYAEELRRAERLSVRDAIYLSARRRMRPIFLTSAAASMGVIPMILGRSGLWMPMGTVICFGTFITMIFLLTVLPVGYWLCFRGTTERRIKFEALEAQ